MTYEELCTLVGTIDKDAEQYMRTESKELNSFVNIGFLDGSFDWNKTKQGHEYWAEISEKLGETNE